MIVKFVYQDNSVHEFEYNQGETILQLARRYDIPIEGACEGSLACSTCHIIVDPENFLLMLKKKSSDEEDLLDYAYNVTPTSRLGCQVTLQPEMDGFVFHIPKSRNYDFD